MQVSTQRIQGGRIRTSVLAVALLAITAGCGTSSAPPAAQSPQPSASPSTPSASPRPSTTSNPRDPATWRSGPGFIGPLKIGATAQALRTAGYVQALPQMACAVRWEATPALTRADLRLEFRGGDPNALDAIVAGTRTGTSRYSYKTAEGVGIGTTTQRLKEVYGDLQYGKWANESGYYVGWVRNTAHGSIMFNVGSKRPNDYAVGDGSHVTLILVTASPFHGIAGGC